ncbi:MAG: DUF1571 domain-containing protein, partial [Planctomycetota bacterium]|nr:DUF1571 domain-containing protein [Planctomycetota bacterium]
MNANPHDTSRRLFLNTLLASGLAGIATSVPAVALAGPRDRVASRDRSRSAGQSLNSSAPSVEAGPTEEAREALRNSPIGPAAAAAERSLEILRKVAGYTTTLIKREQFKSGAAVVPHTMLMKLRREPFSVYFKFIEPHAGREVLYVEGQNKGKLMVHEGSGLASWVGTVSLAPTADKVMEENRYPITMAGLEKGLAQLLARWAKEAP